MPWPCLVGPACPCWDLAKLTAQSGQRDLPHRGSGSCVDEGRRLGEATLDIAPTTHHDLQLAEDAARVGGCQSDHPGPVLSHCGDLQTVLLDVAVTGDDQPTPGPRPQGSTPGPSPRARRWGKRALAFVDDHAGVAGIGDVGAETGEDAREAEEVGIDVEPDLRWLDPAHAALGASRTPAPIARRARRAGTSRRSPRRPALPRPAPRAPRC